MHLLVFLLPNWISQVFQAAVERTGSEPALLAFFGLIMFVIASKVRRGHIQQLSVPQAMDTKAQVVGKLGRIERVPSVQLHAVRSTEITEVASS